MSSDNLKLIGKVALVTGASQGLGFNIAQRFIAEGASVVICARSSTDLKNAENQLLADLGDDQQLLAFWQISSTPRLNLVPILVKTSNYWLYLAMFHLPWK